MAADSEVMTSSEAMRFLRISRSAFYEALNRGEIPSFKVGAQYRFRRSTLTAWIERQEQQFVTGRIH
jgi:excisionase family DNA binding protein